MPKKKHLSRTDRRQPAQPQQVTSIGAWLKGQLEARRWSQRALAERSGVDHSTISRLIHHDRNPSLDTVRKLAAALGVTAPTDGNAYLSVVADHHVNPVTRVEHALRRDKSIRENDVQKVMDYYLRLRTFHTIDVEAVV